MGATSPGWSSIRRRRRPCTRAVSPAPTSPGGEPYGKFLKSTDGGATWSALNIPGAFNPGLPSGVFISALAIDARSPATVYAGASNLGTFKSTDGGTTWTSVLPVSVSALAIDPQTPGVIYAGATDSVYKSSDGGSTWSAIDLSPRSVR